MIRQFALIALALSVASCGVQRPLLRPKDIPAYEKEQREKRERIEREQREFEQKNAAQKAIVESAE